VPPVPAAPPVRTRPGDAVTVHTMTVHTVTVNTVNVNIVAEGGTAR
jgi:hypothetical protein